MVESVYGQIHRPRSVKSHPEQKNDGYFAESIANAKRKSNKKDEEVSFAWHCAWRAGALDEDCC